MAAGEFFDRAQVGTRRGRQLVPVTDTAGGFFPTGEFQINRLAFIPAVGIQRREVTTFAAVFVGDAHLDAGQPIEHVELGDGEAVDGIDLGGTLECHQVDPAAAARAPGAGTEFVAALAQHFAHLVIELGGERTTANARRIGLADAEHIVDVAGADAGSGQRAADRGVRGSHIRVGSVVDIQQGTLGTFKQDVVAVPARIEQQGRNIIDHRPQVFAVLQCFIQHLLEVDAIGL